MTKQYLVIKLETKESQVQDGYYMTNRTEYFGVTTGYQIPFDTLEEAEQDLARKIKQWENYTIIPFYTHY